MSSWIRYLNDPYLVLRIQKYFGVVRASDETKPSSKEPDKLGGRADDEAWRGVNGTVADRRNSADKGISSESDVESVEFVVKNKLWYYLFSLGTELGDELFYATFIPFWFWNVDGAVGRRVVTVWAILMYVGQGIKDIVCWPRPPSPPVFRLQKKWSLEYGMPSTHAMVGVSIPFSVLLYTMARYQYPVILGFGIAVAWCALVSVSRLYLGMHSVLDVVCGLVLAVVLMVPLIPLVDRLDNFLLTSHWSPPLLLALTISLIVFYPNFSDKWTPTRGDTTVVLSVCAGVHIGAWTNYHLGQMSASLAPPPYPIIWPSYSMIGLSVLRCAIGFSCILATRALCKSACYATLCFFLDRATLERVRDCSSRSRPHVRPTAHNLIELSYQYLTYILLGFNILYMLPTVFRLLSIDRPTFYTEI